MGSASPAFALMLLLFSGGAVLIFINFLALRQAVTPQPLLGRMTSTMRWLILIPAGPGALAGGWLGEHVGLRSALAFAGASAMLLAILAWRHPVIRSVKVLPTPETEEEWIGAEAEVRPLAQMDPPEESDDASVPGTAVDRRARKDPHRAADPALPAAG
jgi:hypothetical protein